MLFNGKHAIFILFVNFPCYSIGGLHYVNFPDPDVRNGSPLCPTGHRPFGAAAQKGESQMKPKSQMKMNKSDLKRVIRPMEKRKKSNK